MIECPHVKASKLIAVPPHKYHAELIKLQSKIGQVLIGLLGKKKLESFGYPNTSSIMVLKRILCMAKCQVRTQLEEKFYLDL